MDARAKLPPPAVEAIRRARCHVISAREWHLKARHIGNQTGGPRSTKQTYEQFRSINIGVAVGLLWAHLHMYANGGTATYQIVIENVTRIVISTPDAKYLDPDDIHSDIARLFRSLYDH